MSGGAGELAKMTAHRERLALVYYERAADFAASARPDCRGVLDCLGALGVHDLQEFYRILDQALVGTECCLR